MALIGGMTLFILATAIVLNGNGGKSLAAAPIAVLGQVSIFVGFATAVLAIVLRRILRAKAERSSGAARQSAWFSAMLLPMAALEGGALFATMAWLLNGETLPPLAVVLVLLAFAIVLLPLRDPDADTSR